MKKTPAIDRTAPCSAPALLDIRELRVAYSGGIAALKGVSLSVRAGEGLALIGANGAGKSTLLLALLGLVPAQGHIIVNGLPLGRDSLPQIRQWLGLVLQNPDDQLFMPQISQDVAFGPRSLGLTREQTQARTQAALDRLQISHLAHRSPLRLSGGEKRMAALATVLAMEPEALLLDEPTAFLDPKARRCLISALNQLPQAKLIATHDLDFAQQTCSRGLILQAGQIRADGPCARLLQDQSLLETCGM